jgi:hypothetical protein
MRPAGRRRADVRRRRAGDRCGRTLLLRRGRRGGDGRRGWRRACRQQRLCEELCFGRVARRYPGAGRNLQRRSHSDTARQRAPGHHKRGAEQGIRRRVRARLRHIEAGLPARDLAHARRHRDRLRPAVQARRPVCARRARNRWTVVRRLTLELPAVGAPGDVLTLRQHLCKRALGWGMIAVTAVLHASQLHWARKFAADPGRGYLRVKIGPRLCASCPVSNRHQRIIARSRWRRGWLRDWHGLRASGRRRPVDRHSVAVQCLLDRGARAGHDPALAASVAVGVEAFPVHAGQRLDRRQDGPKLGAHHRDHPPLDLD